ncbi:MAG TPA: hypothetical protein VLV86_23875, partial [Vicinamibacterales bacterium]|nr:hypothetical protein [Vicinamibacterales bacterium]
PYEKEPRFAAVGAWDREQTDITRRSADQLISRNPWLDAHFHVERNAIVFEETVREPRTGGTYVVEHRAEFLSRDSKGSHGLQISLKIHNEYWTDADYSFEEALTVSPARRSPLSIYASYHGLQASARKGVPWFDLLERVRNDDPRVYYNYIGGQGERAPQRIVPWISDEWIDEEHTRLAHAPNRFRRMILNVPAGADAGLITTEELRAAIDATLRRPDRGISGQRYVLAADLGISNDATAIAVLTTDADANAVVVFTEMFRGTPEQPVDLMAVEDRIVEIAQAFTLEQCLIDSWQAQLMATRLTRRGVPTKLVTFEASRIDRVITLLKGAFARRQVRIPEHETALIEQLESVQIVEGRVGKRDTLKFAPSGKGPAVSAHDDLVVAMALALEVLRDRVGRVTMDEMPFGCGLRNRGHHADCYLWRGNYVPVGHPECVRHCAGHLSTERARVAYEQRTKTFIGRREFVQAGLIHPNEYALSRVMEDRFRDW